MGSDFLLEGIGGAGPFFIHDGVSSKELDIGGFGARFLGAPPSTENFCSKFPIFDFEYGVGDTQNGGGSTITTSSPLILGRGDGLYSIFLGLTFCNQFH